MNYKEQMRVAGVAFPVILWGVIGLISALQIGKAIVTGTNFDPYQSGILFAMSLITVIGCLCGDGPRRAVGIIWAAIAGVGFIFFIFGYGLDIKWMSDKSFALLFPGLISTQLIFLPEQAERDEKRLASSN